MTTILLGAGPALAHVTRVRAVADALQAQGHTVHVALEQLADGAPWAPLVADYPLHHLPPLVNRQRRGQGSLALDAAARAPIRAADRTLLTQLRPQVVVVDWRPSMRLAAALAGIPVVALANAHVTRHERGALAAPPTHPRTRWLGQRAADRLMPLLAPLAFRAWVRPYRAYARAHGHPGWADDRDYATGDVTRDPDLPSLAPTWPGHGTYIGPLPAPPLPYDPLPPLRDPILYVTLGSIPAPASVATLAHALRAWPGSVVATRAGRGGDWPARWHAVAYADPLAWMQAGHRVAWVYHGGNGSREQRLHAWASVPNQCLGAVELPVHVAQLWNARRLAALGVVRHIGSLHRSAAEVAVAVQALHTAPVPPAPPALVAERHTYAHAAQQAAVAVQRAQR